MKTFFYKCLLFFCLLVLIKILFSYFYEDEIEHKKKEVFKKTYNTVFIGSSRTMYSIIPAYFDILTQNTTKSYNFGYIAALPPKTFIWCEEIINVNPKIKTIFIELSGKVEFKKEQENQINAFQKEMMRNPLMDLFSFFDKQIANILKPNFQITTNDYNVPFEKTNKELTIKTKTSLKQLELLQKRNQKIEKNTNTLVEIVDEEMWKGISRLIKLAELNNINIYFFIPPRLQTDNELKIVSPIWHKLNKKYKLPIVHYSKVIYTEETSIDEFHLNHKGAMLFTQIIAETFKQIRK